MGQVVRLDLFWPQTLQIHDGLEVGGEGDGGRGSWVAGWRYQQGDRGAWGPTAQPGAGGVEDACECAKGQ